MAHELTIIARLRDEAAKQINMLQGRFMQFGNTIKSHFLGIGVAVTAAIIGAKKGWDLFIGSAIEQEDAIKRLNVALQIQGTYTDALSKKYQNFAESLQKNTRFADDAIEGAMQTLISVGNVGPAMIERATKATLDFADATGRDLNTAALTVAKAAAGFTGELSRYGIVLDDTIPKSQKFDAALSFMEKRFGGAAQENVNTFSGRLEQLKNAFSDVAEEIGMAATQSTSAGEAFKKMAEWLYNFSQGVRDARTGRLIEQIEAIREEIEELESGGAMQMLQNHLYAIFGGDSQARLEMYRGKLKELEEQLVSLNQNAAAGIGIDVNLGRVNVQPQEPEQVSKMSAAWDKFTTDFKDKWEKAANAAKDIGGQTAGIIAGQINSISSGFGESIGQMIVYGKDFGESMKAVFKQMAAEFIAQVIAMTIKWAIFTALTGGGGAIGGFLGRLFHSGGTVEKAHSGLLVAHNGLAVDEVPIIAQTGEGILSRRGMASLGGPGILNQLNTGRSMAMGRTTTIHIEVNNPTVRSYNDIDDLTREISKRIAWASERG